MENGNFIPPPIPQKNAEPCFFPPPLPSDESNGFTPPEIPNMQYQPGAGEKINYASQLITKKKSVIPFIVIGAVVLIALAASILLFAFGGKEDVAVGGNFVEYKGNVYFTVRGEDGRKNLYKISSQEDAEPVELIADTGDWLRIYNDYIYEYGSKFTLDGKEESEADGSEYDEMYLAAGYEKIDVWLYGKNRTFFYQPETQLFAEKGSRSGSIGKSDSFFMDSENINAISYVYLAYDGENLFYAGYDVHEGFSGIYRLNIASGEEKQIVAYCSNNSDGSPRFMDSMKYSDGYVYYCLSLGYHGNRKLLYRVSVDGSDNALLADDICSSDYLIDGDYIYYRSDLSTLAYTKRMALDGSGKENVTDNLGAVIGKDKRHIYRYSQQNGQRCLVRTDLKGKNEEFVVQPLQKPFESDGKIFMSVPINAVILDDYVYYNVGIYYWNKTDLIVINYETYRVKKDGTGNQLLYSVKIPDHPEKALAWDELEIKP